MECIYVHLNRGRPDMRWIAQKIMQNETSSRRKNRRLYHLIHEQRGITIVELIITVVVLGILITAVLLRGIDLSNTAQAGACRANQASLETAQRLLYAESYIAGNPHYASSLSELAPYLRTGELPQCPVDGTYQLLAGGKVRCTVTAHLP